ncbi:hypothetical protein [Limnobacter sp.]|uniref:hypothetical protein n=1 Tax=Limnobacter sp. TaxID=2003368 RepID=UPI00258DBAF0|nr:hypothetical protein [Limnobacter sp.]
MIKTVIAGLLAAAATQLCFAQTFESNMNSFETPLGMSSVTSIDTPVSSTRDANFNRTVVNQPGATFSVSSIGNLVNVQTTGSNNTIVVNANQVNNGNQSANFSVGMQNSSDNPGSGSAAGASN